MTSFPDRDSRERLRSALATGPVVETRKPTYTTRSSAGIVIVTLEGGLEAFWKRGDVDPPGVIGIRREVAAYEIALALGWDDLLQVVAHRREPVDESGVAEIASIELLPDGQDDVAWDQFRPEDAKRAGVFDALIQTSDRGGHNWRGIPDSQGSYRLKLYDHESAFDPGVAVNSTFWNEMGQQVPESLRDVLRASADPIKTSEALRVLLPKHETSALAQRLDNLAGL